MKYEIEFEDLHFFELKVPWKETGKEFQICLRISEDKHLEKQLIDYRGEHISCTLQIMTDPSFSVDIVAYLWFKTKLLEAGNQTVIILHVEYTKDMDQKLVDLKYNQCRLLLGEPIQPELITQEEIRD